MLHKISGNNFHGDYEFTLRGPVLGFVLSKRQMQKADNALCGMSDCKCGGRYGDGADAGSATLEQSNYDEITLVPAV